MADFIMSQHLKVYTYILSCYVYYAPETFLRGTLKPWSSISTVTALNCSCCVASQTCHTDVFT